MPKTITKENFITRSNIIHYNKYNYDKIVWIKTKVKIIITCPIHGDFQQMPSDHLKGAGCKACGITLRGNKRRLTSEDWSTKMSLKFNNKFDYSKVIYTGIDNKVKIICPLHGEFEQIAYEHQVSKHGCTKCAWDSLANERKDSLEMFINKANIIHNYLYDYPFQDYKNQNTLVSINCSKHGLFMQTPGNHLSGKGCPTCSESKGETLIRRWLEDNNFKFKSEFELVTPEIARNTNLMKIDFFVVYKEKQYFIEYDGIQHFEYIPFFHNGGIVDFTKQQQRDKVLNEFCELYKDKVTLIRFNYKQSKEEIINILENYFK